MIHIRRAGVLDAANMAELLNEIISIGGTTAFTKPVSRADVERWMQQNAEISAWHVAEDETGALLGYQYIKPHAEHAPQACDIATFVRTGRSGLGIGSKLFDETKRAARMSGYRWINATIRADNLGGLAYYQSRGFEDYAHHPDVVLADGYVVDKVSKRYTL